MESVDLARQFRSELDRSQEEDSEALLGDFRAVFRFGPDSGPSDWRRTTKRRFQVECRVTTDTGDAGCARMSADMLFNNRIRFLKIFLVAYTEPTLTARCNDNQRGTGVPTNFSRVVLITFLSVGLATSARAETLNAARDQIVTGIVVVSAGVAVGVTLLILHQKHKHSTITGCVRAGANGMDVTDERDKRIYALAGDPVGAKPGERMKLEGKRHTESGKNPAFEARSVIKDYGACQP